MDLGSLLQLAIAWLAFDSFTDCLCIALALAVFAIARNIFRQSK